MIDRTQPIAPLAATTASHELHPRSAQPKHNSGHPEAENQTSVTLSSVIKHIHNDNSRDVNFARVAELRAALEAEELPMTADKVAQNMVQHIVSQQQ